MTRKIVIKCSAPSVYEATIYERKFILWKKIKSILLPLPYCQQLIDYQTEYNIPDKNVYIHLGDDIKFSLK